MRSSCKAMGLSPQWVQLLVVLQLRFENGQLFVIAAMEGDPGVVSMVTVCLLGLWRFRNWSAARWCGILQSSRCLIGAVLVGLQHLVRHILDYPRFSNYYIAGFQNLTPKMVEASCTVCACGHVSERCLASLLKDDQALGQSR